MKINFIVPFVEKTGGIKMVFTYANELSRRGHDVKIYYPFFPYAMSKRGIGYLDRLARTMYKGIVLHRWRTDWFVLKVPVQRVPIITDKNVRDADVVIATAWPTAYTVANLPKEKGEKYYFIQHYEIWSGSKEEVDNSYRLDLHQIVIAGWLKDIMESQFHKKDVRICQNGIDLTEFYPESTVDKQSHRVSILLLAHPAEIKGMRDGVEVVKILKEKGYDVTLRMFGMRKYKGVPEFAEFYSDPSRETLRKLYSESDIYLFPSWLEGWGLTVVEAMACRCAVVGNRVGCLIDIGSHEENCMLTEPHDISGMVQNIIELITDSEKLEIIKNNGYITAKSISWDKSFDLFERIIEGKV